MNDYLILRLQGFFQSWGGHTYESFRPTELFPTRSGLIGLLAACIGIKREERQELAVLSRSFIYAVRANDNGGDFPSGNRMEDFHTIQNLRKVDGSTKDTEITRRQYLEDSSFTVALKILQNSPYDLETMKKSVQYPFFMPYLGRKSCPLGRPLFEGLVNAVSLDGALRQISPFKGTVYSEEKGESISFIQVRDVPFFNGLRQFGNREVFIYSMEG